MLVIKIIFRPNKINKLVLRPLFFLSSLSLIQNLYMLIVCVTLISSLIKLPDLELIFQLRNTMIFHEQSITLRQRLLGPWLETLLILFLHQRPVVTPTYFFSLCDQVEQDILEQDGFPVVKYYVPIIILKQYLIFFYFSNWGTTSTFLHLNQSFDWSMRANAKPLTFRRKKLTQFKNMVIKISKIDFFFFNFRWKKGATV